MQIFCYQFEELTHTCGYNSDLVYTHIHYCLRPSLVSLAARIRISISSNFPLRSFHVATMCHRTEAVKRNIKWPVVYLCNTQLILRSYFFFFFFFFSLSLENSNFILLSLRTLSRKWPAVMLSMCCVCSCVETLPLQFWHANTFDPAAACDTFLPISYLYHWLLFLCCEMLFPCIHIFSIALWLLLIATSHAISV